MIGAIPAKKLACSGLNVFSQHDLPKFIASWAENSTFIYPGNSSMSGEWKGRKTIEVWYAKVMERFPKIDFTVKKTFVSNIFALGPTNNIAIEWESIFTDSDGNEFLNNCVMMKFFIYYPLDMCMNLNGNPTQVMLFMPMFVQW